MLKLKKFQYFGHLMPRADSLKNTLILGKIEGRRRKGRQRMRWLDEITNSMDMSLSTKSRRQWRTGNPEMLCLCGHKELDMTYCLNNKYSIIYTTFIFIHSSVSGHLGCFCILAIVNNGTVNIGVHLSFWIVIFVFFEKIPRSGISWSRHRYFLRTSILFSIVATPMYVLTDSTGEFAFLHIFCFLFENHHSDMCEVISHCGFDLYFFLND